MAYRVVRLRQAAGLQLPQLRAAAAARRVPRLPTTLPLRQMPPVLPFACSSSMPSTLVQIREYDNRNPADPTRVHHWETRLGTPTLYL